MEKHTRMVVHATPNTQPGGVQGAIFWLKYQLEVGPLFISKLPMYNPPKFMIRNNIKSG